MMVLDRRFVNRVPLEMYLNTYVQDRPQRAVAVNLSETGLFLNTVARDPLPPLTQVGLEFSLPGMGETIWAAGEMRYDAIDDYFYGNGIRFTAMASLHERMLRHYLMGARRKRLFPTLRRL